MIFGSDGIQDCILVFLDNTAGREACRIRQDASGD